MPNIRLLNTALAKKAKEELLEDPNRIDSDLESLRKWIKKQSHLRCRTDYQFLVQFLRGSKYSMDRSKNIIDTFFTFRTSTPEFYADRNPANIITRRYN